MSDVETKIAALAALAALGSAYWAWSSAKTARLALYLAESEYAAKSSNISVYLINSLKWARGGETFVSFALTYTNGSSSPTTINRVELVLHAFDMAGHGSTILLSATNNIPDGSEFEILELPINLAARASASGWATFLLPSKSMSGLLVDKYEILATTWEGEKVSLDAHIVLTEAAADGP